MRDMIKPAFVLCLICLVVGAAMAFTNMATVDVIKQRIVDDAEKSRKIVLSEPDKFLKLDIEKLKKLTKHGVGTVKEAYIGQKNGEVVGFVFVVNPKGYAGEVNTMIGIDVNGKITGIQIGENKETPGLGTKANEKGFKSQFIGKKFDLVSVVKKNTQKENEIEAISGATITSKSVSTGVEQASRMANTLLNTNLGVSINELVEGSK